MGTEVRRNHTAENDRRMDKQDFGKKKKIIWEKMPWTSAGENYISQPISQPHRDTGSLHLRTYLSSGKHQRMGSRGNHKWTKTEPNSTT